MDGQKIFLKLKNSEDLPENCKKYIEFIENYLEVPISLISVGQVENKIYTGDFN